MRISGVIVQGKQLGRTIGFPTANLQPDEPAPALGENGVYIATIQPEGFPEPLRCMLNQGHHPTAPGGPPTIEAYILDFSGELYGKRAVIEYLAFLRPERRFASLDALREQLTSDREATRAYFER